MFFAMVAIHASPSAPGTAYEFSHHSWGEYKGEFGRFGFARGGMGAITEALAAVARHNGAEIRTGVDVKRILVKRGLVTGVRLQDGTSLECKTVISNADPYHTYVQLLDPDDAPADLLTKARQIDLRGSMGRIHLLVDQLPQYVGMSSGEGPQHRGFALLGATPAAFERGWEAQRRGELMDNYPIELIIQSVTDPTLAPPGLHTISTGVQQLPFTLAEGTWDSRRQEFADSVLRSLFHFAPNQSRGSHPKSRHAYASGPSAGIRVDRRKHFPWGNVHEPAIRLPSGTRAWGIPHADKGSLPVWCRNSSRWGSDGRVRAQQCPSTPSRPQYRYITPVSNR